MLRPCLNTDFEVPTELPSPTPSPQLAFFFCVVVGPSPWVSAQRFGVQGFGPGLRSLWVLKLFLIVLIFLATVTMAMVFILCLQVPFVAFFKRAAATIWKSLAALGE